MTSEESKESFWDHLDILRTVIIKIIAVWCVASIISFIFKNQVFRFILAPEHDDFITYRIIDELCIRFGLNLPEPVSIQLINTGLAQQFMIHMKTAMCVGFVICAPYALYQVFSFIAPGLYRREKRYTSRIFISGYAMFLLGIALSYYILFPMTFQFLGSYQVSDEVINMISLDSYMSTLIIMSLSLGILCELPVLSWLLAKLGVLKHSYLTRYRRHAIVIILIVAAIITPTSDIFTLLIVSLPIWLLYEVSVLIVRRSEKDINTSEMCSATRDNEKMHEKY